MATETRLARDRVTPTSAARGVALARGLAVVVPLLVALVPPVIITVATLRYSVNVPYKDHWGHVPFIVEAVEGSFKPSLLWEQINEHRMPVARLLQGLLAWATRWDVRWEAYADLALALATLAVLADLVRRTVWPIAPWLASWVVLVASLLHCSIGQGNNWTWGAMMPAYLAALPAALLAWLTARYQGRWGEVAAMIACAAVGALSFGSGLTLLGIAPLALLVTPAPVCTATRLQQVATAAAVGGALTALYLIGWHGRADMPAVFFHPDRLADYQRFLAAYLGRPTGVPTLDASTVWGTGSTVLLLAASAWLLLKAPSTRRAVMAWWMAALYAIATGVLTAYGRLDTGLGVATAPRYLPTSSFFLTSVVAVAALAIGDLTRRSVPLGVAAAAFFAVIAGQAVPTYVAYSYDGLARIRALQHTLAEGAKCLPSCPDAPDACLLQVSWSAQVARFMCPQLKLHHIGPYAFGIVPPTPVP